MKKTILLVEDDAIIALSESKELERAGYSVLRATTGEKAVELVSRNSSPVDLILMDIDLGDGIDGAEAARRILRICDIPILFLSSHIEPEIVLKTEEITNYGYVVKASSITVLDASIKMAFRLFSARRQLDLSNERFRAVVENTPDHIIMMDGNLRYTMVVNPQLGLTEAGMLGKTDQEILPSEEAEALTEVKRRVLESGEPAHLEMPVTNTRGELEYFDGSYIPRFDASGKADGLIGYFRNVTKEHASGVRIEKLVEEKELLVREMRHRVLNNLATLAGYLSLQITGHESDEAGSILKSAISQTKGMQLLFDKLYRPGHREGVSLRSFMPDLVDEILGTFGRRSEVVATVDIDDVVIDSSRLSALGIMVNELITNSMKHASKGTARLAISLTATREGERIRLVYGDNGPGLPPGVSVSESPGFGLTLIEGLADQIDGTLRIESGDGARFIVEFDL